MFINIILLTRENIVISFFYRLLRFFSLYTMLAKNIAQIFIMNMLSA